MVDHSHQLQRVQQFGKSIRIAVSHSLMQKAFSVQHPSAGDSATSLTGDPNDADKDLIEILTGLTSVTKLSCSAWVS